MAVAQADVLEQDSSMSVLELSELVKAFEEKFGVSAAAVAVAGPAWRRCSAAEEQTEFTVNLSSSARTRFRSLRLFVN